MRRSEGGSFPAPARWKRRRTSRLVLVLTQLREARAPVCDHHYQELAAPDVWDWDAVTKLGRRIIYHVRKRLAVAKVDFAVVLAEAEELRRSGWTMR